MQHFYCALAPPFDRPFQLHENPASAGALDGIDHWDSLTSVAVEGAASSGGGPRTEMLYNWDAYELSSADTV